MKKNLQEIWSTDFNKAVITLLSGTALAQLITFGLYPLISRLYTPADFGVFGLITSVMGIIALVATTRYELAIILPANDQEASKIVGLSFVINTIISLISLIAITLFYFFVENINESLRAHRVLLFLIPLLVFLTSASNILQNWLIRKKEYKALSASKIIQSIVNNGIIIFVGLMSIGVLGLLGGMLLSAAVTVIFLFIQFKKSNPEKIISFEKSGLSKVAKKYIDLPTANTFQALSESFQSQGIIFVISYFFSMQVVGLYSFALRILMAPLFFFVNSFTQVFYQSASELYAKGESLVPILRKTVYNLALLAFPLMLILMIFGPSLFAIFFGEEWRESGVYARMLAPYICIDFLRYGVSQLPIILGKVKQMFYWSLLGNLVLFSSLLFGIVVLDDLKSGFVLISITMTLYFSFLFFWIYKLAKNGNSRQT
ncbi:MAG: lipopolysaccharide biosynthesis protein [Bacteroidia bacterium]